MRILVYLILTLLITEKLSAQQDSHTQSYVNLPYLNAGITGVEDFMDLKVGFRQGWNDFNVENSSTYLSISGPLNKTISNTTNLNSLRVSDPTIFNKVRRNSKARRKHGVGMILSSRSFGPYKSTSLTGSYAYHLPITGKLNWAMGVQVGSFFQKIDFSNYTVRDVVNDLFYQDLVMSNQGNSATLIADFGSVIYTDNFYVGIASKNLINTELTNNSLLGNNLRKAYSFHLGRTFNLSRLFALNSNAEIKIVEGIDPTWSVNARVRYLDIIYLGASFEEKKRISLLVGLVSDSRFSLHYSYDKYIGDLAAFNVDSHEFTIGISIFNKYRLKSKFW